MKFSQHLRTAALMVLFLVTVLTILLASRQRGRVYWGARVRGETYGVADAPWDSRALAHFEAHARKKLSIVNWGQPWWHCYSTCDYQAFTVQLEQYETVRQQGYIPLIDWASWDHAAPVLHKQPAFALQTIIQGDHDDFIRRWATEARDWGHPFFLRFNWEMNGDWFPWSEAVNGNKSGEFILAWRHVHGIFQEVGADNVTWVWCVNVLHGDVMAPEPLYPGDAYVDWTCMDGYNWGVNPSKPDRWLSFLELFFPTYERLQRLAPHKPVMIGEMASTEIGGSKAAWIREALGNDLIRHFPNVKAVIWFNWNIDGIDWVIESSPSAQHAFASSIGSAYFTENEFNSLSAAPIPPPGPEPLDSMLSHEDLTTGLLMKWRASGPGS